MVVLSQITTSGRRRLFICVRYSTKPCPLRLTLILCLVLRHCGGGYPQYILIKAAELDNNNETIETKFYSFNNKILNCQCWFPPTEGYDVSRQWSIPESRKPLTSLLLSLSSIISTPWSSTCEPCCRFPSSWREMAARVERASLKRILWDLPSQNGGLQEVFDVISAFRTQILHPTLLGRLSRTLWRRLKAVLLQVSNVSFPVSLSSVCFLNSNKLILTNIFR